jgi:hypothetical protein
MVLATREEIRTQVILGFERRNIKIRHLEIIPTEQDGGWRIGPAMLPSLGDPAVRAATDDILVELHALQLDRRNHAERRIVIDATPSRNLMKVMVLEDNVLTADMIAEALAAEGCLVVGPIGSLDEGMDVASAAELTGALLDIDLRGELSFPIAYRLREQGVPFAFISAYPDIVLPPDLRNALRFSKPFTPWELASSALRAFAGG